jgi:hypothetical protein
MQQLETLEICGTGNFTVPVFCGTIVHRTTVCAAFPKGKASGSDLTSLPLGGKTQAAGPIQIRSKAASGPEPAVEYGGAKGTTGSHAWRTITGSGIIPRSRLN